MGRRGEQLSDFQRGTVVGCHLCQKSTREISALLNLPRSTVGDVVLKWKREGITTALPRPGRPQKLGEEQRQLLERVALDRCLPTVEALTAEFRSTSGAKVSSRTVRKELKEMGFTGRVTKYKRTKGASAMNKTIGAAYTKTKEVEQSEKTQTASTHDAAVLDVSRLDLRVGRIISSEQLPEADRVYLQQVDVGEDSPRMVVSQLKNHIPLDQLQKRPAVLLCNVKPVQMFGSQSQARLMNVSSPDKMELIHPPDTAVPGDRVTVRGFTGEADREFDPEQQVWDQIQTDLRTDHQRVVTYRGSALEVAGKGVCQVQAVGDTQIEQTLTGLSVSPTVGPPTQGEHWRCSK